MGLGARGMHELGECGVLMTCASIMPCADRSVSNVVDIFNVTAGTWSNTALSQARWFIAATSLPNVGVAIFAGGGGMLLYLFGSLQDGFGCERDA
jgi:hypothetical protein